jgi:transposase
LKLYIYGYLYRAQSSRRLQRECHRNLEVMWLLGRLAPDYKTIADFRKDNGAAIKKVCGHLSSCAAHCDCCRKPTSPSTGFDSDGSCKSAVSSCLRNQTISPKFRMRVMLGALMLGAFR